MRNGIGNLSRIDKKAGSSMVEVLVATVIVSLVMAMFAKTIASSADLYRKSSQLFERTEQFDEKYYKSEERANRQLLPASLKLETEDGTTISLPLGEVYKFSDSETGLSRYSVEAKAPEGGE